MTAIRSNLSLPLRLPGVVAVLLGVFVALAWVVWPAAARAQGKPADSATIEDARDRFRRGVELYREGDFRNALIEFNRAYGEAPNFRILYNVGQTCMELQDYACAAKSYSRYLEEADESLPPGRREEVLATLVRVKRRVSNVAVTVNVAGAEIFVDDVLVGRAPLEAPVVISAGRRKVSVSHPKYLPATRTIDVAGGDTPAVRFDLAPISQTAAAPERRDAPEPSTSRAPFWIAAGTATLAVAATATFAALAVDADSDHDKALASFPTTGADIESARSRASRFALATDISGGVAIVAGVAALYFGLRSGGAKKKASTTPSVQVGLGHLSLQGAF